MYWTSLCDFSREYHWVEFDLYPHHLSQCWPHGQHAVNGLHSLSLTWAHAALKRLYRHEFKSLPHHFSAMCSGILLSFSSHMCKMVKTIGSLWQLHKWMYATLSPQYFTCAQQIVQLLSLLLSLLLLAGLPLQIYYWGFHSCVWPWFSWWHLFFLIPWGHGRQTNSYTILSSFSSHNRSASLPEIPSTSLTSVVNHKHFEGVHRNQREKKSGKRLTNTKKYKYILYTTCFYFLMC